MAVGAGAFQNNPKVANQGADDATDFQRMLQMAMLASMMSEKSALGFGLGSLIGGGIKHRRDAADRAKIAALNQNKYQFSAPNGVDILMQKWSAPRVPTMQEITAAGASLNQNPQAAPNVGAMANAYQQNQYPFSAPNGVDTLMQKYSAPAGQPAVGLVDPNKRPPYGY